MALRTVIVGFGAAAIGLGDDKRMTEFFPRGSHAAVLADHPAFDWRAVVDPSEAARARAAEHVQIVVPDLASLPDPETFECAVVASPPESRTGILDRLPNLKAVMLEKPLAESLAAAEQIAQTCAARGIIPQVNYWRRGVDGYQAMAAGGLASRIGDPQAVFGVYGGGLRNSGSHLIDLIHLLFGEISRVEVAADLRAAPDARLLGDLAGSVHMNLANGAPVRLLPVDFLHYREVSLDIWGTRGRLAIEQESLVTKYFSRKENRGLEDSWEVTSDAPEVLDIRVGDAFLRLYDNLADTVAGRATLLSGLTSAIETERVLDRLVGGSVASYRREACA